MGNEVELKCKHENLNWRAASDKRESLNEEGWECIDCDAVLGFRPDLDRSHAELKAYCIMQDFHESKLIYVSNGTMGELIAANVAAQCLAVEMFDQQTILKFILEDPNMNSHGEFWRNRSVRWLGLPV